MRLSLKPKVTQAMLNMSYGLISFKKVIAKINRLKTSIWGKLWKRHLLLTDKISWTGNQCCGAGVGAGASRSRSWSLYTEVSAPAPGSGSRSNSSSVFNHNWYWIGSKKWIKSKFFPKSHEKSTFLFKKLWKQVPTKLKLELEPTLEWKLFGSRSRSWSRNK